MPLRLDFVCLAARHEFGTLSGQGASLQRPWPCPGVRESGRHAPNRCREDARRFGGYGLNYFIDAEQMMMVGVEATPARNFDEAASTRTAIERADRRFDLKSGFQ